MKKANKWLSMFACLAVVCALLIPVLGVNVAATDKAKPTMPKGNKNFAEDITGASDVWGCASDRHWTFNEDGTITSATGGCYGIFAGPELDGSKDHVVEMTITFPKEASNKNLNISLGANAVDATGGSMIEFVIAPGKFVMYDYSFNVYETSYEVDSSNYIRKVGGSQTFTWLIEHEADGMYLTTWVDDELITWVKRDGSGTVDRMKVNIYGGNFGAWNELEGTVTLSNLKAYYADPEYPVPTKPLGNQNYADKFTGVSKGVYTADEYYDVSFNPLNMVVKNDGNYVGFTGVTLPTDFVAEMDIVTPVVDGTFTKEPEYRIIIGNGSSSAWVLMSASGKVNIYKGYKSSGVEGPYEHLTAGEAAARVNGTAQRVVIQKKDSKLSVWVDGTLVVANVDIADVPSGFGFTVADGKDRDVTLSNVDIYDINQEAVIPSMPAGNKNFAEDIDGASDVWGCASDKHWTFNEDGTITSATGGCQLMFTGTALDGSKDHVVEMKVTFPEDSSSGIVNFALGASTVNATGGKFIEVVATPSKFVMYDYSFFGPAYENSYEVDTANYTRKQGGTQTFTWLIEHEEDGTYLTMWVDGELMSWVKRDGTGTVARMKVTAYGGNFGVWNDGISGIITLSDLKAYYLASDKEATEKAIAAIPAITKDNYSAEKAGSVAAAKVLVETYLANNETNTTDDISNYAALIKAEEDIAYYEENDVMFQAVNALESVIAAIPVITEENFDAELVGSIKTAEDAVAAFAEEYPDYDLADVKDYDKIAVSKKVAENGGVADNLLYYATGMSLFDFTGYTTLDYDKWNYAASITDAGPAKMEWVDGFELDNTRIYKYSVDVTAESLDQDLRIPFKGNGFNSYIYFRLSFDSGKEVGVVTMYDPLEFTERNLLAKAEFNWKPGTTYHVDIITGPEFATVAIDGKVVVSGADITICNGGEAFTGSMIGVQNASAGTIKYKNMHLSYYEGEIIVPDTESENLLDHASAVTGNEGTTGFYGIYAQDTNTLEIGHSGLGGVFEGVTVDRTKVFAYGAIISTPKVSGDIVLQVDGDTIYDGLCVSLGESGLMVYETAYGEIDTVIASEDFTVEAGKEYALIVLVEGNKLSVFVDEACIIADAAIDPDYELECVAAYANGNDDATLANMILTYVNDETLATLNALKEELKGSQTTEGEGNTTTTTGQGSEENPGDVDTGVMFPVMAAVLLLTSGAAAVALKKRK